MPLKSIILSAAILFSSSVFGQGLTLQQSYEAALNKTEPVAIQQSIVNQNSARVSQARAGRLPNVAFNGNVQRVDNPGSFNDPWQSSTRLSLVQSIFQGGRNAINTNINKNYELSALRELQVSKNNLFADVSRSFYTVLANQRDIENIQETIKVTEERVSELKRRQKIGRSRDIDTMTAQAQLLVLKSNLQTSQRNLATARDVFAYITGLDRDTVLDPNVVVPAQPQDLNSLLEHVENTPEIQSLEYQSEALRYNIRLAKSGHLPSANLTGNYYFTRTGSQINRGNWDIGAGLTFPIFMGGIVKAQTREALELRSQTELFLRQRTRELKSNISVFYDTLSTILAQIQTLEQAKEVTQKTYRQQEKDYKYGLVTNLDVIDAQDRYLETKRSLDQTKFDALMASSDLSAAINQVGK